MLRLKAMKLPPKRHQTPEVKSEIFKVSGQLKKAMAYILAASPYSQEIFALGGGISLLALLIGNKYSTEDGIFGNLYAIGIGPTGCGKDAPRGAIKKLASQLEIPEKVVDNIASGPGLEDYLEKLNTPVVLLLIDEFGKALQQRKSNGDDHGITAILLKLYTSVNSHYIKRLKAGDKQSQILLNPFVSIYGVSTKEAMETALSEADAESGWLGRILFLSTCLARPKFQQPCTCQNYNVELKNWYKSLNSEAFTVVGYSDAASKKLASHQYKVDECLRSDTLNPIVRAASVRRIEMTKKLALISAVSRNPLSPIINIQDVKWASSVTKYSQDYIKSELASAIENGAAGSLESLQIKKALRLIQRTRTFHDSQFSHATKNGYMPKRMLLKKMTVNSGTLDEILSTLKDSGEIVETKLTKEVHGISASSAYSVPKN
jgi:hypothetical protein